MMRLDTVRKLVVGVIAISTVAAIGPWLLSFIPSGFAQIVFAIGFAVLVPAIIVPACLRFLRRNEQYTGAAAVLVVSFTVAMIVLQGVTGTDAITSAYGVLTAVVIALAMSSLAVMYDLEGVLVESSE